MKFRRGFKAVDNTGTSWFGDCKLWADEQRRYGMAVTPIRILGSGRWRCASCVLRLPH